MRIENGEKTRQKERVRRRRAFRELCKKEGRKKRKK